jgi:subtilase family serine protease
LVTPFFQREKSLFMNQTSSFAAKLSIVLVAAVPMMAQAPKILQGFSTPPLHRVATSAPGTTPTGIFPAKMRVAYGFSEIKDYGRGQIIGIVDAYDDPNIEADFGVFNTEFKLPTCTTANGCFKKIYGSGTKPPSDTTGWSNEMTIDVDWSHAIAPAARVYLIEATSNSNADLYAAVDTAVANGCTIVSMSFSGGETSDETSTDFHFDVPNVTMTAASGDGGHSVGYPAASPYVVAVGGTSLTINSSTGAWESEVAWSGSGGGESAYEAEPVYQTGYQPTGKRGVPDVAYDADPNTGVPAYSSWACSVCYTGWTQWGGTSIGTPMWAGLFADANGARVAAGKANLNQPQFLLYPASETDFHDITSGTNGSCGVLCTAKVGYDFVTGLGSPQANLLVPTLVAAP